MSIFINIFVIQIFFILMNYSLHAKLPNARKEKFKNIILIVADDLGWSDIGYAKNEAITPNLDRLANEGIILNQLYTYSLCTPSRASVLSGIFAEKIGLQHSVIKAFYPLGLSESLTLMPQYFKKYGFETHMIGKWNLGFCKLKYTPAHRGFNTFYGYFDALVDYYAHRINYKPADNITYDGLDFWDQTHDYLKPVADKNGTFSQFLFNQRAIEIIESHNKTKPFFLYFSAQTPHKDRRYNCPKEYSDRYLHVNNTFRQKYLGLVSILDESIGNITNALKKNKLLDDTIIFFMSDNGGENKEYGRNYPLRGGKRTVFEGGHRVRAFISGKNLKHHTYEGMFHSVDWLPTILSAALNKPIEIEGIDGINQWNSIIQNSPSKRNSFIYNVDPIGNGGCNESTEALRYEDWKLIRGCPGILTDWYNLSQYDLKSYKIYSGIRMSISNSDTSCLNVTTNSPEKNYFLFNIKNDPFERINLADKYPCKIKDLELQLDKLKKSFVTPLITEPPNIKTESNPINYDGKWMPGWC